MSKNWLLQMDKLSKWKIIGQGKQEYLFKCLKYAIPSLICFEGLTKKFIGLPSR